MAALRVQIALLVLGVVTAVPTRIVLPDRHETVFLTNELVRTFETLGARGCLPEKFGSNDSSSQLPRECAQRADSGCSGVPTVALFYNCLGDGMGLISKTRFDTVEFNAVELSQTDDALWRTLARGVSATCQRSADARLTPRQQAIYQYTCWKWMLFADCDHGERGAPSVAALRRRAVFLSGSCPLSPSRLLDPFGLVTGRTWLECSPGKAPYVGSRAAEQDPQQRYASELRRVSCLLQDFGTSPGGRLDSARLTAAVSSSGGDKTASAGLLTVLERCAGSTRRYGYGKVGSSVTVEEFVACWARTGVLSCAPSEANALALLFHQDC